MAADQLRLWFLMDPSANLQNLWQSGATPNMERDPFRGCLAINIKPSRPCGNFATFMFESFLGVQSALKVVC